MDIASERITDPRSLSPTAILKRLSTGGTVVVQFSKLDSYSTQLLQSLNDICRQSSSNLEIRFYGHYGSSFDAAALEHLPEVKNLSLDCLSAITNRGSLSRLKNLSVLSFGVFDFDHPEFLAELELESLTSLSLGENRKRNLNLTPLSTCLALERLFIEGHYKGIEVISGLSALTTVTLRSLVKTQSAAFLSEVPKLKDLTLTLGSRSDISDFESKTLETLQILRVRGFQSFGNLTRFPTLRNLRVEDQVKLECLDLTGAQLERLWVYNCKFLKGMIALNQQMHLREFFASKVALDLEYLRDRRWPASTQKIGLFSKSLKWNESTNTILKERGYSQDFQYWS